VAGWAALGIPLKIAFSGIDRYFDRYYAKGPRRRPVRIDFCEADVLDQFDQWRRVTGLSAAHDEQVVEGESRPLARGASLPAHMERVLRRLTSARAAGALDAGFDDLLDRLSREMDGAVGARGAKRQAIVERLAALDRELLDEARSRLDEEARAALVCEADEQLASFQARMSPDAFERAREAAIDQLIRERSSLPTIAFH
jgi:hypothetical protein